jgi:peptidoglycan/LPS O-acetylase OafA/YrhL
VSRRRYVVAVILGALIVFSSASALVSWFQVPYPILPAFALGSFAAGWNVKARTLRSWIIVVVLTSLTAIAMALAVAALT